MAVDLEYIMVPCDHSLKHELILESTQRAGNLLEDATRFGVGVFGDGFGAELYIYVNNYGDTGEFVENEATGEITAIIPLQHPVASAPKLYIQLPDVYNRVAVPQYASTVLTTLITFGADIYLGEVDDLFLGAPGYIPQETYTSALVWEMVYTAKTLTISGQQYTAPANSVVIYRYNGNYDWWLDYTARAEDCPLCKGSGVKNDLALGKTGALHTVYDMDKLVQQVTKAIITLKGKNEFFPSYGTTVTELLGKKGITGFTLRAQILEQLTKIKNYQQTSLSQNTLAYTARELLEDVLSVKIFPGSTDPRVLTLELTILNRALEKQISKVMRL